MLLELALDKSEGKPGAVNRDIDFLKKVCKASDVILMTVGKNDSAEFILVLDDVGEIGDNEVYAEHIIVGECESAVHDEHIVAALIKVKVLAYLVETAERRDEEEGTKLGSLFTGALAVLSVLP